MRSALPLLAALLAANLCFADPTLDADRKKAVDDAVNAEIESQQLVGIAVGVIEGGEIVYLSGFGFADREQEIPIDPKKTMFRWASISKTLTALAAMQLAEKGRLDLDADVREYVPEFPDKGVKITPRQLLCHQGGIVHYTNGKVIVSEVKYDSDYPFKDVILALDRFKESPLVNEPGEKYSYSTHGYILLSAVVQRAGEEPFADQVRERVARPLEMATLRPDYHNEQIPDRAVGYRKNFAQKMVPSTDTDVGWKLGGGGFISTCEDLAKYARGLMKGGLVSEESRDRMWTAQKLNSGEATTYGLGFGVGGGTVGHSGSQEKTRTLMLTEPAKGRGVVIMTNREGADVNRIAQRLREAMGW